MKGVIGGGAKPSLTVHDVARSLRCSENYVRSQLNNGTMGGWKLGADWRIEPDDLEDWKKRMRPGQSKERTVGRLRALEGGR